MADNRFADIILQKGLIGSEDLSQAKSEAERSGLLLEDVLESRGVSSDAILEAKTESSGVPAKSLEGENVPFDVLKYIPEDSARHYKFVPLGVKEGVLEIGVLDPSDLDAREALQFIASKLNIPFRVYLISAADFKRVLEEYKG